MTTYKLRYLQDDTKVLLLDEFIQPGGIKSYVVQKHDTPGCFVVTEVFEETRANRLTDELKALKAQIAQAQEELKGLNKLRTEADTVRKLILSNQGLGGAALLLSGKANWAVVLDGMRENKIFKSIKPASELFVELAGTRAEHMLETTETKNHLKFLNLELDLVKALKRSSVYSPDWFNHEICLISNNRENNYETYVFFETEEEARAYAQEVHDRQMELLVATSSDLNLAVVHDAIVSRLKLYKLTVSDEIFQVLAKAKKKELEGRIAANQNQMTNLTRSIETYNLEIDELDTKIKKETK